MGLKMSSEEAIIGNWDKGGKSSVTGCWEMFPLDDAGRDGSGSYLLSPHSAGLLTEEARGLAIEEKARSETENGLQEYMRIR